MYTEGVPFVGALASCSRVLYNQCPVLCLFCLLWHNYIRGNPGQNGTFVFGPTEFLASTHLDTKEHHSCHSESVSCVSSVFDVSLVSQPMHPEERPIKQILLKTVTDSASVQSKCRSYCRFRVPSCLSYRRLGAVAEAGAESALASSRPAPLRLMLGRVHQTGFFEHLLQNEAAQRRRHGGSRR